MPRSAGAESFAFTQVLTLSSSGLERASANFPEVIVFSYSLRLLKSFN